MTERLAELVNAKAMEPRNGLGLVITPCLSVKKTALAASSEEQGTAGDDGAVTAKQVNS